MADLMDVRKASDSSSPSDPSRFADLDRHTQLGAFRGLAAASIIYACAYFLAYTADWLVQIAAAGHFKLLPWFDTITTVAALSISVAVFVESRRQTCEACAFTRMATMFLIVGSLGIALQAWGWEQTSRFEIETVSWVGVWLVSYPGVVTLAPRQLLIGALLGWLTVPIVATASILVHGVPAHMTVAPWLPIVQFSVPVLICAGVAYAIAYRVFCLARDVSKARRLGSYQLSEKIGAGGMGEVWRAQHRLLARPAAVKLIHTRTLGESTDGSGAQTILRRFEREAQSTALLTSPHSIMLYDFGITEDGVFYYVMELLEGRDLKSLVRDAGPLPPERAVHFLRAACDSLADAHHRGLIHRDVKPANLFTCRRGRDFDFIKVLDFGLVKDVNRTGDTLTHVTATNNGVASGTPGFMAPEMVTNDRPIDGRADIYGLGCVAYWLLTGQLVFEGNSAMSVLIQHVKETPPPVSSRSEFEIPRRLEEIVHACLAKDPDDRPESAELLGEMLAEVAKELPAWTPERAEKWWRTNLPQLHAAPLSTPSGTVPSAVANA